MNVVHDGSAANSPVQTNSGYGVPGNLTLPGTNYGLPYHPELARWYFGWDEVRVINPTLGGEPARATIEGQERDAQKIRWTINGQDTDVFLARRLRPDGRPDQVRFEGRDLDVWIEPDLTWSYKDEDELRTRAQWPDLYWVDDPARVYETAREVVALVEAREFPFDGSWLHATPDPAPAPIIDATLPAGWDRPRHR